MAKHSAFFHLVFRRLENTVSTLQNIASRLLKKTCQNTVSMRRNTVSTRQNTVSTCQNILSTPAGASYEQNSKTVFRRVKTLFWAPQHNSPSYKTLGRSVSQPCPRDKTLGRSVSQPCPRGKTVGVAPTSHLAGAGARCVGCWAARRCRAAEVETAGAGPLGPPLGQLRSSPCCMAP